MSSIEESAIGSRLGWILLTHPHWVSMQRLELWSNSGGLCLASSELGLPARLGRISLGTLAISKVECSRWLLSGTDVYGFGSMLTLNLSPSKDVFYPFKIWNPHYRILPDNTCFLFCPRTEFHSVSSRQFGCGTICCGIQQLLFLPRSHPVGECTCTPLPSMSLIRCMPFGSTYCSLNFFSSCFVGDKVYLETWHNI